MYHSVTNSFIFKKIKIRFKPISINVLLSAASHFQTFEESKCGTGLRINLDLLSLTFILQELIYHCLQFQLIYIFPYAILFITLKR